MVKANVFESIVPPRLRSKFCPLPLDPAALAMTCPSETVPTKLNIVPPPSVGITCSRFPVTPVGEISRLNCIVFPSCCTGALMFAVVFRSSGLRLTSWRFGIVRFRRSWLSRWLATDCYCLLKDLGCCYCCFDCCYCCCSGCWCLGYCCFRCRWSCYCCLGCCCQIAPNQCGVSEVQVQPLRLLSILQNHADENAHDCDAYYFSETHRMPFLSLFFTHFNALPSFFVNINWRLQSL